MLIVLIVLCAAKGFACAENDYAIPLPCKNVGDVKWGVSERLRAHYAQARVEFSSFAHKYICRRVAGKGVELPELDVEDLKVMMSSVYGAVSNNMTTEDRRQFYARWIALLASDGSGLIKEGTLEYVTALSPLSCHSIHFKESCADCGRVTLKVLNYSIQFSKKLSAVYNVIRDFPNWEGGMCCAALCLDNMFAPGAVNRGIFVTRKEA